ncbi:hypothetical protein ACFL5Z_18505 [Planctomycetota bacterium]
MIVPGDAINSQLNLYAEKIGLCPTTIPTMDGTYATPIGSTFGKDDNFNPNKYDQNKHFVPSGQWWYPE